MPAGRLIIPNMMPAEDGNGDRIPGAKLYFYDDGTTDLKAIFTSSALTVERANPVEADSVGVFPVIWADTAETYTVVGTESDGTPLPGISYDAISASIDATLASTDLAEAAADSAAASATTAGTAATTASAAAVTASAAAVDAVAAAATAEEIAGFDPALYQLRSEEGQANGYCPLDASGLVPDARLTGAPISTDQQAALDAKQDASTAATKALAIAFAVAL